MGTFKDGKEFGQQRVIKSKPEHQRSFMQYTSENGILQGQALIERADTTVEAGSYLKNKQHGIWRIRLPNGQTQQKVYQHGVIATGKTTPEGEQRQVSFSGLGNKPEYRSSSNSHNSNQTPTQGR